MSKYHRYLPYFAGIIVSVIFGFSFMFTKNALDNITPFHLLAFRFATAALMLTVLMAAGLIKVDFRGKALGELLILSVIQPVFYFICETTGVSLTSSSEAGMMIALIPVVVAVLSAIFLKEIPTKIQSLFIVTSVAGVFFIIFMNSGSIKANNFGMIALMGAVISAGIYNILSRKLSLKFTPVEITFVMMWFGAITFNLISLGQHIYNGTVNQYMMPLFNGNVLMALAYLGILSSVAAFFMMNFMLSRIPASQSAVFSNLTTVVSIIAGVAIRGENFYWYQLVGAVLILLGVWGTNYFGLKEKTKELQT
jgi:drug/metabolite transporter (DMT)-like permease